MCLTGIEMVLHIRGRRSASTCIFSILHAFVFEERLQLETFAKAPFQEGLLCITRIFAI